MNKTIKQSTLLMLILFVFLSFIVPGYYLLTGINLLTGQIEFPYAPTLLLIVLFSYALIEVLLTYKSIVVKTLMIYFIALMSYVKIEPYSYSML